MLTLDQLRTTLARVTYKPGWELSVYPHRVTGEPWIFITAALINSYQPDQPLTIGVRSPLPPMPTGSYFLTWLRWRLNVIEQHELDEWLKVDGTPLNDPHMADAND